jgi:hypothetical protein
MDPVTGTILGTTTGGLTLLNALVKIYQDHKADPKQYPPALAELIAALPAMALKLTGELTAEVEKLRHDCYKVGIDLKLTFDELQEQTSFYHPWKRHLLKVFQSRVEGIVGEISIFFDDFVAVANCCDRPEVLSRSFAQSKEQKIALRKATAVDLPLGMILENLQKHAEDLRAEVGDLRV